MRLCIIGGKLQGIEASYLAKKAGYETLLVDKIPSPPAKNLVNEFHHLDVFSDEIDGVLESSDAVLPAVENMDVLKRIEKLCDKHNILFLHDSASFNISSDKKKSQALFEKTKVPHPKVFKPTDHMHFFPLIVKPSCASGSVGVMKIHNESELQDALNSLSSYGENIVTQEFVDGTALSLELIGNGGSCLPFLITGLEFDESYSCKRVYTFDAIPESVRDQYVDFSLRIAHELGLKGLMDTQSIVDSQGVPKMIEINARLPSQTPTVVYKSTGLNLLQLLYEAMYTGELPNVTAKAKKSVAYQHIMIQDNCLYVKGEHILIGSDSLELKNDFFGAEEAITNMDEDAPKRGLGGVATLIVSAPTYPEANEKMESVMCRIAEHFKLKIVDCRPIR